MARVPTFNEQQRISTPSSVQITDPSRARVGGEVNVALGSAIQGAAATGQKVFSGYEKRFQMAQEDKTNDTIREFNFQASREAIKNTRFDNNGTSDMLTIYRDNMDNFFNDTINNAPDESRERITSKFNKLRIVTEESLKNQEQRLGWSHVQSLTMEKDKSQSAQIQASPSQGPTMHQTFMNELADSLKDSNLNQVQIEKLKNDYSNKHANDIIDGYTQKAFYDINYAHQGLAALKRSSDTSLDDREIVEFTPREAVEIGLITDEEAKSKNGQAIPVDVNPIDPKTSDFNDLGLMLKNLTPPQRDASIKRFQQMIKSREKENFINLGQKKRDVIAFALSGSADSSKPAKALIKEYMNNSSLNPEQKARNSIEIASAVQLGQSMKLMHNQSLDQWSDIDLDSGVNAAIKQMEVLDPSIKKLTKNKAFMSNLKEKYKGILLNNQSKALRDRKYDSQTYIEKHDARIRNLKLQAADGNTQAMLNFNKASLAKQIELKIDPSDVRLLTRGESAEIGRKIIASQDPSLIEQEISEIEQKYGSHTAIVLEDMIQDKVLPSSYGGIITMSSPVSRRNVIFNSANAKSIKDDFKANVPSSTDKSTFKAAINKSMSKFSDGARAASTRGNSQIINTFREQVTAQAMQLHLNEGLSFEDAAERASEEMLNSNYGIAVHSNGKSLLYNRMSVSKGTPVSPPIMQGFVDYYSDDENMDKIVGKIGSRFAQDLVDLGIPQGDLTKFSSKMVDIPGPSGERRKVSTSQIRDRWISEIARDGRWVPTKSGAFALTYKGVIVKGKNNEPVQFTYEQISNEQGVLDETRSFAEKLFGGG